MLLKEMQIFSICHTDLVFAWQISLRVYSRHPHPAFYKPHLNSRHPEGFNSKWQERREDRCAENQIGVAGIEM